MKNRSYLLWATGVDRPGFVAAVTKKLFELGCNLEDSSMMRLGAEFAIFLIFSSEKDLRDENFSSLKKSQRIELHVKKILPRDEGWKQATGQACILRVHGPDHPGIVYRVTEFLAKHRMNITDLSTHRTTAGKRSGYILLIEGELPRKSSAGKLKSSLKGLEKVTKTKISFDLLPTQPL